MIRAHPPGHCCFGRGGQVGVGGVGGVLRGRAGGGLCGGAASLSQGSQLSSKRRGRRPY